MTYMSRRVGVNIQQMQPRSWGVGLNRVPLTGVIFHSTEKAGDDVDLFSLCWIHKTGAFVGCFWEAWRKHTLKSKCEGICQLIKKQLSSVISIPHLSVSDPAVRGSYLPFPLNAKWKTYFLSLWGKGQSVLWKTNQENNQKKKIRMQQSKPLRHIQMRWTEFIRRRFCFIKYKITKTK